MSFSDSTKGPGKLLFRNAISLCFAGRLSAIATTSFLLKATAVDKTLVNAGITSENDADSTRTPGIHCPSESIAAQATGLAEYGATELSVRRVTAPLNRDKASPLVVSRFDRRNT